MPTQQTPPRIAQGVSSSNSNVTQQVTQSNVPFAPNTAPVQPDPNLVTVASEHGSDCGNSPAPNPLLLPTPLVRHDSMQSTLERNREL